MRLPSHGTASAVAVTIARPGSRVARGYLPGQTTGGRRSSLRAILHRDAGQCDEVREAVDDLARWLARGVARYPFELERHRHRGLPSITG